MEVLLNNKFLFRFVDIDESTNYIIAQKNDKLYQLPLIKDEKYQIFNSSLRSKNLISQEEIKDFIKKYSLNDKMIKIMYDLIENVRYFTTLEIVYKFRKSFIQFLNDYNKNENYYLLVPTSKYGSEHWLLSQILDLIPNNIKLISKDTQLISDVKNIVIIDDAIYSGNNVTGTIDEFLYEIEIFDNLEINIITALCTYSGERSINENIKHMTDKNVITNFYNQNKIKVLSEIFTHYTNDDWNTYNELMFLILDENNNEEQKKYILDSMMENYGIPVHDCTTIYLKHKIPNEFGTITNLLNKIIKEKIDRSPINNSMSIMCSKLKNDGIIINDC
jgi:hypothetical protein